MRNQPPKLLYGLGALLLVAFLGFGAKSVLAGTGAAPASPATAYGCVTGLGRVLEHVYTNQQNYINYLNAHGGKCPHGFEVTTGGGSPAPAPSGGPTPSPTGQCVTSAAQGKCGPYDSYPKITGTTSSTYIGNNVWNPISGWQQTLSATDPGNWHVTADMPAGNTAIASYPSIGANYGQTTDVPTPLSDYASIYSSFTEDMHATSGTSAWAAYDVWVGQNGCSSCKASDVMIQHDFANNGACTAVASATFGGSNGVPSQPWHLCQFGSELVWKLGTNDNSKISEQSGSVDILAMVNWLVTHGYLPANTGLWSIGYGWEIASTGGQSETFTVSNFSLTPTCKTGQSCTG